MQESGNLIPSYNVNIEECPGSCRHIQHINIILIQNQGVKSEACQKYSYHSSKNTVNYLIKLYDECTLMYYNLFSIKHLKIQI